MPDSLEQKEQDELELLEEEVPTKSVPAGATVLEIPQDVPEGILSEKLSQAIKEAVDNSGGDNPLGKSRIGVTKSLYKNPADSKKARKLAKKMRATNRRHNSNHRS